MVQGLDGKVLASYAFDRLDLQDVTVTPDGHRLLGVGTLHASPTGLTPSKSRGEKQLVVYNMVKKEFEKYACLIL